MSDYNLSCPEIEALAKLKPAERSLKKTVQALDAALHITGRWQYNDGAKMQVAYRAMAVMSQTLKARKS